MRLVIVGATGNVGTSLLRAVEHDPQVDSVLGIARRKPDLLVERTKWAEADVSRDELVPLFRGADAVVHLAWAIQPSRDLLTLWRINVEGSARVFRAVADAGVKNLVYGSSVGAYSPGPKGERVDESWPTNGIPTSFYARHKAEVERRLDRFEREQADIRVVRLRPGLIFKRESATEQRRLFAGPFLPGFLVRPGLIPVVPDIPRLRFQAVHSHDVGVAYRLAATSDVRGPFNIAADPVLDPNELGRALDARPIPFPAGALRIAADVTWRLHLQPTPPGWIDLALNVPLLDTTRARTELGWEPQWTAADAIRDVMRGMREGAGLETPPMRGDTVPRRAKEVAQGVGQRGR
jgi:UDP-glucose 4-epimerase